MSQNEESLRNQSLLERVELLEAICQLSTTTMLDTFSHLGDKAPSDLHRAILRLLELQDQLGLLPPYLVDLLKAAYDKMGPVQMLEYKMWAAHARLSILRLSQEAVVESMSDDLKRASETSH